MKPGLPGVSLGKVPESLRGGKIPRQEVRVGLSSLNCTLHTVGADPISLNEKTIFSQMYGTDLFA